MSRLPRRLLVGLGLGVAMVVVVTTTALLVAQPSDDFAATISLEGETYCPKVVIARDLEDPQSQGWWSAEPIPAEWYGRSTRGTLRVDGEAGIFVARNGTRLKFVKGSRFGMHHCVITAAAQVRYERRRSGPTLP